MANKFHHMKDSIPALDYIVKLILYLELKLFNLMEVRQKILRIRIVIYTVEN